MELLKKGYYLAEGKKWEDWHAGHKEEGFSYKFLKIIDNNTFFSHSKTDKDFDFISFLKKYRTIKELQDKTTVNYGSYTIEENLIKFDFVVLDKYPMHFELEIITPELLRDKDGRQYHFVPVEEEKLKGLPEL